MYYISLKTDNSFGFRDDTINPIAVSDKPISEEIYNQYFALKDQGKEFKIKDINGTTFEEIFEEIIVETAPAEPSEVDQLKEQIATMRSAIDYIITYY